MKSRIGVRRRTVATLYGIGLTLIAVLCVSSAAWAQDGADALDRAVEEIEKQESQNDSMQSGDIISRKVGDVTLRLMDVSLDVIAGAGWSSEQDASIANLQAGGHDPSRRGFTLQNVELSLMGAVDPYVRGEAHLVFFLDAEGESRFELEEAFLQTQSLPYGLQVEAGHFFTEFGRINPRHPHAWQWQDQPVILSRVFGPDGARAPGVRVGWLMPLPWFSEFHAGVQNANGETMSSFFASDEFFEEAPIGGRPFVAGNVKNLGDLVYLLRLDNSFDLGEEVTVKLGGSGMFGPNATGPSGETRIYGADLVLKWWPVDNQRGWPFVLFESELIRRDYRADAFNNGTIAISKSTLRDWGFYAQVLYGFLPRWAAGVRYEYASGSGASIMASDANDDGVLDTLATVSRNADPFRDNRHRISPLLVWQVSEYFRLRLQYNYDRATHLTNKDAHSVWGGIEFLIGSHPAHEY